MMVCQKLKGRHPLYLALGVFLAQIPLVYAYVAGWVTFHPIVVMLPLVGLINYHLEDRGHSGLGLFDIQIGKTFLLAGLFAAFSFGGKLLVLSLLRPAPLDIHLLTSRTIIRDLLISFLILATFEEVVNRGFIQTRLQDAYGFWGVVMNTLMFTSLHLPDLLIGYWGAKTAIFNALLRIAMVGFLLSYVYWWTSSLLTTLIIHGMNNFATSLFWDLSQIVPGSAGIEVSSAYTMWTLLQVILAIVCFHRLYGIRTPLSAFQDAMHP